jgi:2-amino-4-hydroxy-6-hydroxymethyldihydropteridine diphosphokinase
MSEVQSPRNLAAISLGSNIDPLENLPKAVLELAQFGRVAKVSRVYESAPVGFRDQPNFLNAAVLLETSLGVVELQSSALKSIEAKLHRVRDPHNKNAPRTIDLDLSLYIAPSEEIVLDEEILNRPFVAVPLGEILPDFVHPVSDKTLAEIARVFLTCLEVLHRRPDCDLSACQRPML